MGSVGDLIGVVCFGVFIQLSACGCGLDFVWFWDWFEISVDVSRFVFVGREMGLNRIQEAVLNHVLCIHVDVTML